MTLAEIQLGEIEKESCVKDTILEVNRASKTLILDDGNEISLPLSSSVGKGDSLLFYDQSVYVKCNNGLTKILPPYIEKDSIELGDKEIQIIFKEITNQHEIQSYEYLKKFHYRNNGNSFGRQAIVVAKLNCNFSPVVGFIQISCSPILNKARFVFLDAEFSEDEIEWKSWNKQTSVKYSKIIAEITRVVVHPEYRGLGVGQKLLKHAFSYVKDFWQVGKIKPLFIEITADMLKFIPFAEKAGMIYIGNTEGNLNRLKWDLKYYFRKIEEVNNGNVRNS